MKPKQKPADTHRLPIFERFIVRFLALILLGIILSLSGIISFDTRYKNKIYPNVFIGSVWFGGKTQTEVEWYWKERNRAFEHTRFEFVWGDMVATVSGKELSMGYDAQNAALTAYEVGRSGIILNDLKTKFLMKTVDISPAFFYKTDLVDQTLSNFQSVIDTAPVEGLFTYENGKVTAFKQSKNGQEVDMALAKKLFADAAYSLPDFPMDKKIIEIPVTSVEPTISTDNSNEYGIQDHIGTGYSEFHGSIPGRIHNVALAASRFHGVLIPPDSEFSFNETLGDVSAATGYKPAYIIKDGRTILGDGGGVCQVSTTLFRAAMNAGLPISERHAHSYRVHYYEEAGYKAGIDATVFSPSVDLKFVNDTPGYILIQAMTDTDTLSLSFDFYGQSDGRTSTITDHIVSGSIAPPPPLYQDDPTLPEGVVKQVDWAAWGAKASFNYSVIRNGQIIHEQTFISNYQPWRAVYLKGTKV